MAPFNTHFLVAEKIWPDLPNRWQPYYGQFCFGCVAPDVDKTSKTLTQIDTHFFDQTSGYEAMVTKRTAMFLAKQHDFLTRPFAELAPDAQAFILGYLCHLAVDEVSKHLWRPDLWEKMGVKITSAFAVADEVAWQQTQDYSAIHEVLNKLDPLNAITKISVADLEQFLQGVRVFTAAKSVEAEFDALIDMFIGKNTPHREAYRQYLRDEIEPAKEQFHLLQFERVIEVGVQHSQLRLNDLIAGRIPEAAYPEG
ncbi:MAG: zinc dependent phospholipase C family protein [Chloroflexota bacterium]